MDPTAIFSRRAKHYALYRPSYAPAAIDCIMEMAGLEPGCRVADIGSGTGILSQLFLARGCHVFAVEPNQAMRQWAESRLQHLPRFTSVVGTAEASTLSGSSVDLVSVGQAFHWFDTAMAQSEFRRILKPGGQTALLWNRPSSLQLPYIQAVRQFKEKHQLGQEAPLPSKDTALGRFFEGTFFQATFDNAEAVDWETFSGGFLSASWAPLPEDDGCGQIMSELRQLFEEFAEDGLLQGNMVTELYLGALPASVDREAL